jgi:hypothetical protein
MPCRLLRAVVVTATVAMTAACGGDDAPSTPAIVLTNPPGSTAAVIDLTGLSRTTLRTLASARPTPEQWSALLRVSVGGADAGMLGTYAIVDDVVRFTPAFPLDAGRAYHVQFDPARIPGASSGPTGGPIVNATVMRPAEHTTPSTVVTKVYPTGETVPSNLLRMYVEFSNPMGRPSGIPHMKMLDESGQEIAGAFLPLDYEFWSPDHTRFTAFFDPGRVKEGILPNQQMGRPLTPGTTVTLVISREWRDEHGLPLKDDYRRVLRVGPADRQPLDPATWTIHPPASGARTGLVVTFPEPLDHGLLMRALGVARDGTAVEGDIAIEQAETRWTFTPRDAWRPGTYQLVALDILEDVAGNQIGRAFEVDNFDTVDKSPNPKSITIPFRVGN